ncbi:MAG: hypothetical protein JOY54_06205 [Acidobacteriaceae bacterium]|nr:hypothetical protein [Acidobacteriaceae bacterium]
MASSLGVFRIAEVSFKAALGSLRRKQSRRVLKFWLGPSQTRLWGATQQVDGRFVSQVSVSLDVLNTSHLPICIARVEIAKPKCPDVISSSFFFPSHDYHTADYETIDAYETATAQIHITANGLLSHSEAPIPVNIAVFDHQGTRYLIKGVVCGPIPKPAA